MMTTRQAAVGAAMAGVVAGLVGGSLVGGLSVLRYERRARRLDDRQSYRRLRELERMMRAQDALIAALSATRPPVILDECGSRRAIPALSDRVARPARRPALTPPTPDPAGADNPLPAIADLQGDIPAARSDR